MPRGLPYLIALMMFAASGAALAQTPSGIRIQSIDVVGTGCPAGSYNATISPDAQTFSLLLDSFVAESSMQRPIVRLNCELRVNFQVPAGWTFAVTSADYRGFAYAEVGTLVTHQALFSFDGSRPKNERPGYEDGSTYNFRAQEFRGPYNDTYYIRHEVDPRQAPWAACNSHKTQSLYITTYLMARNLNLSSLLTAQISLDSIDGQVQSQKYRLAWKTCRPGNGNGGVVNPPDRNPGPGRPNPNPRRPPRFP